jgi:hypothetical protein
LGEEIDVFLRGAGAGGDMMNAIHCIGHGRPPS